MKKIVIEKHEDIVEVIDRMLAASDDEILFVIHKGSALAKSASNFRLLKREAGLAEKKIRIESVDETIIELAEANEIAISGVKGVSDIVPKTQHASHDEKHEEKKEGVKLAMQSKDEEEEESFLARDRFFKSRAAAASVTRKSKDESDRDDEDDEEGTSRGSGKTIMWVVGTIVALVVIFYAVTIIFGRAQVTIDFTKTPWSYQHDFIAEQSVATTTAGATSGSGATVIPAQVFTTQKNVTQVFPATGPSVGGGSKAQGTITIYNNFGATPQDLVATTRFITPDGKIFRLVNNTTVPAAKVGAGGAITPSSVDAPIIADQGGPSYDVGPIAKLTIPGFQSNAAKYAGFYGAIKGQTTGGTTGSHATPTAADVTAAKASTTAILQADLMGSLAASYPNNFKILDGATSVQVTKLTVNTSTDANGNFSVFGEASLTAIGFDKSALESYLLSLVQGQVAAGGTTMAFKDYTDPNYSNVQASFSKGQVSFSLSAQETVEPAFSSDQFASSIAGKSIATARDAIQNLPQLSDGKISVWPIWLWNMPANPNKISVTAN